ncbi:MAG: hypothetical protein R3A80_04340 [Bdellovibrionota bacterium]
MRSQIAKALLLISPSLFAFGNNCVQDGKILAQVGFIVSPKNEGNLYYGAASYKDTINKDVELFSKTMDAVFLATEDYAPKGVEWGTKSTVNGKPVHQIKLDPYREGSFIEALPAFESQIREIIDSNPKFKEVYAYPENPTKEQLDAFYERARAGVQVMFIGSDHGAPNVTRGLWGEVKLQNLSGNFRPSSMGALDVKSYEALAKAFRGMPTMHLHGQCQGADAAREIIDHQMTENRKINAENDCVCFAAQAQPYMAATNPRVGEQFESEPIKKLDKETQKFTLLQAAGRGIKDRDLAPIFNADGTISTQGKDAGMTGSEVTFLPDVQREFQTDNPVFFNFKDPKDISSILAKKKDGSDLFSDSEKKMLLESELERIKAVYFILRKDAKVDTNTTDLSALYSYVSEKRKEVITELEQYKQTKEQRSKSLGKIEGSRQAALSKIQSLITKVKSNFKNKDQMSQKAWESLGALWGTIEDLEKRTKDLNLKDISTKMSASKHWDSYLEAKKTTEAFKFKLESVSDLFLHEGLKQYDQEVFKSFAKEIQAAVDASDLLLKDLLEPVQPVLIAETILSRTLTETKVMKYMADKDDQALAKKKDEFFRQRRCELMDLRPKGNQMYGQKSKDALEPKKNH